MPHLVAMWFAVVDGDIWFETKAKSQKVVNLRRDPRISCLVEAGHTYDTLRGVELEGTAEIVEDPDALWAVGVSVWERYNGPYSEEVKPLVEFMLTKRVAVRIRAERTRTWDHRKLGMPAQALGGTHPGLPRPHHLTPPQRVQIRAEPGRATKLRGFAALGGTCEGRLGASLVRAEQRLRSAGS